MSSIHLWSLFILFLLSLCLIFWNATAIEVPKSSFGTWSQIREKKETKLDFPHLVWTIIFHCHVHNLVRKDHVFKNKNEKKMLSWKYSKIVLSEDSSPKRLIEIHQFYFVKGTMPSSILFSVHQTNRFVLLKVDEKHWTEWNKRIKLIGHWNFRWNLFGYSFVNWNVLFSLLCEKSFFIAIYGNVLFAKPIYPVVDCLQHHNLWNNTLPNQTNDQRTVIASIHM